MITETTTAIEVPRIRLGLKVAAAVAAILAAIALAISFNGPAVETAAVRPSESAVVDYALRHMPVSPPVDYRSHDYALRHSGQVSTGSFANSPDYALRHMGD